MNGPNDIPSEAQRPVQRPSQAAFARFSRSAGIDYYRRKRFHGRAFKAFVTIVLLAILGGVGYLFSRQILKAPLLPSDSVSGQSTEKGLASANIDTSVHTTQMSLVFGGDVIMTDQAVFDSGRLETGVFDFNHLFRPLAETLSAYDLRAVNQETGMPLGEYDEFGMGYSLGAAQALGRSEVDAGFNVILHANDHAMENGVEGIHNELAWWQMEYPSIPVLGMADPDNNPDLNDYVNDVYVFERDGLKVAVLNHTLGVWEDQREYLSALDEQKITYDVQQARDAGADLIVACPHWGDEGSTEPSEDQVNIARLYANLGVDVVVGTHPRVLQRVDVLEGEDGHKTVCFYSLGCLVSGLEGDQSLLGGLAQFTLERYGDGTCGVSSATLKPVVTHKDGVGNREGYATYLLADYTDELAQTSANPWITPEDAANRCAEILGEDYDRGAAELRVDL